MQILNSAPEINKLISVVMFRIKQCAVTAVQRGAKITKATKTSLAGERPFSSLAGSLHIMKFFLVAALCAAAMVGDAMHY